MVTGLLATSTAKDARIAYKRIQAQEAMARKA
jgi:hypothetical protein